MTNVDSGERYCLAWKWFKRHNAPQPAGFALFAHSPCLIVAGDYKPSYHSGLTAAPSARKQDKAS